MEKQCTDAQSRLETQDQDDDQDDDLCPTSADSVGADLPKGKDIAEMSVKELKQAIVEAGLESQSVGFCEKSEFVTLLLEHRGATGTVAGEARQQLKLKCPPDFDEEIFYSLPEELQLEVVAEAVTTNAVDESKVCDVPFPKMGVTIQVFLDFIEDNGGQKRFEGLTTEDVTDGKAGFILKATQEHKCSYCELLQYQKDPNVGTATVFISHACKQNFLQVVNALQNHFKDTPDVFVWFSSFSNNQHLTPNLPFEWFTSTFKSAIQDFGHTVMVLHPITTPFHSLVLGACSRYTVL